MNKFSDYLTVKQAAGFLGICAEILRRWDRVGKLKSIRNPLNGYRLYNEKELTHLLESLHGGQA